ncbi:MAG: amino acid adenylation domain-containing protein [Agarilytica sp.]
MKDLESKLAKLSPEKRALLMKKLSKVKVKGAGNSIPRVDRTVNSYPLSLVQQSYWFIDQLEGGSSLYNTGGAFRILGDVDISLFEKALQNLLARHESLRTNLKAVNGKPKQVIRAEEPFRLELEDISPASPKSEAVKRLLADEFDTSFDLENDVLVRVRLIKLSENDFIFTFLVHHVVFDGWSIGLFLNELLTSYSMLSEGQPVDFPELPIQYIDYAVWQEEWTKSEAFEKEISYWKENLQGASPLLNMPTDFPRPPTQSYDGATEKLTLPIELIEDLNKLARENGATLFMVMLAALNIVLSRFANTKDVLIGTATANRTKPELESLIGFFANTIVLRNQVNFQKSFVDFLAAIKHNTTQAFNHSNVPFDMVVDAVQPERSLGVPPVFQVNFILQNAHVHSLESLNTNLKLEAIPSESTTAKLDLNLFVIEGKDEYLVSLEYATALFKPESVQLILSCFKLLLEQVAKDSTRKIGFYSLVTEEEKRRIERWNKTTSEFDGEGCIHHLFEKQVENTPGKLAYVFGARTYTYRELNSEANKLSNYLTSLGVGPEVRVGVSVNRGHLLGIAMLAVLKSGGTYIPLNPSYPDDRLQHMVEDTQPVLILTQQVLESHYKSAATKVISLDEKQEEWCRFPSENPTTALRPENSAYVLYTSGSTGLPKGILVAHKSFRNMALAHQLSGFWNEDNRVLQFASMSFSISLWSSFMAWLSGATLYQVNDDQSMPGEPLYKLIDKYQITIATLPVSLLSVLPEDKVSPSLKTIISCAEPCNLAVAKKWSSNGRRFFNMYGNSEVSLGSSLYEYIEGDPFTIGKPFPNTKMFLLDENLQQVPVGVLAEIHTSGLGLAKGYINRPDATAENFIPNHLDLDKGNRLYKTGDLGRYLSNGEIEFHGRDDFQVSIRGFRIETNEIEKEVLEREDIEDAVVVARPDPRGIDRLVCFMVAIEEGVELDFSDIRKDLSGKLPNFMVPSIFQQLERMPLTPNRKVDRIGLPAPDLSKQLEAEYCEPSTETQQRLVSIWEDLMDLKKVGIRNNFFEIGGHSLLATQLVARIQDVFDIHLPVRMVFEHATIEALAERVEELIELHQSASDLDDDDMMELTI